MLCFIENILERTIFIFTAVKSYPTRFLFYFWNSYEF